MKKFFSFFSFFSFLLFLNCGKEIIQNNCLRSIDVNQVVNLSNPEFLNLQVPGGYATTNITGRNILIIRRNDRYQAFDLQCPEKTCTTPMVFDGLKLTCSCSNKEYNSLNGSSINGEGCFILEYIVVAGNNTLQIKS